MYSSLVPPVPAVRSPCVVTQRMEAKIQKASPRGSGGRLPGGRRSNRCSRRFLVPSGVLGAAFNLLERRHSAAVAPIYCACRTRCHRKSWTERAHTQFSPGPIASMLPFNRWLLSEGSFVSKFCGKCCRQRAMYRLALIALPLTSRARARCQRRSVSASSTRLMVPRMTEQQVDARCDGSTLFWQRHDAAVSRARPYVKKCQLMRPRECMPRASVTQPVWGMYYSCPSGICEP